MYSFGGSGDGIYQEPGVILSGNKLYGVGVSDGSSGSGTVFSINTDGTGYTNVYDFTGFNYYGDRINSDGAYPSASLILSSNELYGTAWVGGNSGCGTVFKVDTNGLGFTNLHSFTGGNDGANPFASLVLGGSTLYGTTSGGGSSGNGTVFAINTDGTGFTNLYSFTALDFMTLTNTDGANPRAGLFLAGKKLYGTAPSGGSSGSGTVFAINTDGTDFTNLYSFTALDPATQTNTDGAIPYGGLLLSGDTLYGTAAYGGSSGDGTVFAINADGTGFTNLYSFTALNNLTNIDGAHPFAGLILSGNILYGTTHEGGDWCSGAVFAISTDGTAFTNLYSVSDGAWPLADLVLAGSTLYGTTSAGGSSYDGTLFALSLVSSLGITPSGNQVVISWPTWAPNYGLQVTTNLSSGIWSNIISVTNTVGGNYVFTNAVSSQAAFFRLSSQ
jgi:uncharacterized repeat protein (TIGR03803 family)